MKHSVYVILCPDTQNVVYVGVSQNVELRFNTHLNTYSSPSARLRNWISEVKLANKLPVFKVIFETSIRQEACEKELEMIGYYSELNPLINSLGNPKKNIIKQAQTEYEDAVKKASIILAKSVARKYSLNDNFIIKIDIK